MHLYEILIDVIKVRGEEESETKGKREKTG